MQLIEKAVHPCIFYGATAPRGPGPPYRAADKSLARPGRKKATTTKL